MSNVLRIIDELEQQVEKSGGFLGKRLINEEKFFTKIQMLRSALPQALKDAEAAPWQPLQTASSSRDVLAWLDTLPREQQREVWKELAKKF